MNQNQQFPIFLLKYKETSGDSRLLHNTVDQENMHFFLFLVRRRLKELLYRQSNVSVLHCSDSTTDAPVLLFQRMDNTRG